MKRFIIISMFFVLFSFLKTESLLADRLLFGIDSQGYGYYNKSASVKKENGGDGDDSILQCKPDKEKNENEKTGDFITDECGDKGAYESFGGGGMYPNLSLEINFGKPSTGWGLMFVLKPTNKHSVKFVNFPNDNESAVIEHDIRFIGIPIMYTWGDPELGKNGSWAVRLGFGPSLMYYDPLIVRTKDKTITKRGIEDGTAFFFFSYDWSKFSFIYQQLLNGSGFKVDEIKDNSGEPIKITTSWNSGTLNYSWYF